MSMTAQTTADSTITAATPPSEFDLDLSIVSSGTVIADLMRSTDDNCGATCQSACSNSTC